MERQAHDDGIAAMTADDAGQRTHVIAAIGAIDSKQWLGGNTEFVGDGDTDASIPMIEA
jgi:hypothetical protein